MYGAEFPGYGELWHGSGNTSVKGNENTSVKGGEITSVKGSENTSVKGEEITSVKGGEIKGEESVSRPEDEWKKDEKEGNGNDGKRISEMYEFIDFT